MPLETAENYGMIFTQMQRCSERIFPSIIHNENKIINIFLAN